MNIDMLVFGEDWGQHPSSTQHLIQQLHPQLSILWINSIGLRRPRLNGSDLLRAWQKLGRMLVSSPTTEPQHCLLADTPKIINPRAVSWPSSRLARLISQRLLSQQLKALLNHQTSQAKQRPILWTSLPSAVDMVGQLNERATVYYCCDDFSALEGVDHQPVARMEQQLVDKSQLVVVTSKKLASKFPGHKTFLLPHGVDTQLFSSPCPAAAEIDSKTPTAGFYGSIASWLDQQLMAELARLLPHWKFLLIGPVKTNVDLLLSQPNIQLLGPKPHSSLPSYSQHWDASLLPFVDNRQIAAANPLKLREYLAAGSPVVSSDFPALDGYRDLVKVRSSAAGFAQALRQIQAAKSRDQDNRVMRQQRVSQESWQARAQALKAQLEQL